MKEEVGGGERGYAKGGKVFLRQNMGVGSNGPSEAPLSAAHGCVKGHKPRKNGTLIDTKMCVACQGG